MVLITLESDSTILNFALNNQNNLCSCIYKTSWLVKRKVVSVLLTSPCLFAWISLQVRFQIQRRYLSISDFSCYSVRRNCNKKLKAALKLFFFLMNLRKKQIWVKQQQSSQNRVSNISKFIRLLLRLLNWTKNEHRKVV